MSATGTLTVDNGADAAIFTVLVCDPGDGSAPCESFGALSGADPSALVDVGASWETDIDVGTWWSGAITEDNRCDWSDEFALERGDSFLWTVLAFGGSWDPDTRICAGG
jgi:hypothetical protein